MILRATVYIQATPEQQAEGMPFMQRKVIQLDATQAWDFEHRVAVAETHNHGPVVVSFGPIGEPWSHQTRG